jgi:hypothetical protein
MKSSTSTEANRFGFFFTLTRTGGLIMAHNAKFVSRYSLSLRGFTVNQNYQKEIEDARKQETVLWQLIPEGNKVIPKDKTIESNIRCITCHLKWDHFERSLLVAQKKSDSDKVAGDTKAAMVEFYQFLERQLFQGNSTIDPFAFNGLQAQMPNNPKHIFTVDLTSDPPESIADKIDKIVAYVARQCKIDLIFASELAYQRLKDEVGDEKFRDPDNQVEIVPDGQVFAINGPNGRIPVYPSQWIDDIHDVNGTGSCADSFDCLRIYLTRKDRIKWYGVPLAEGSQQSFEPQIFDCYSSQNNQPLLSERILLMYGTLYLEPESLWRIDIKVRLGESRSQPQQLVSDRQDVSRQHPFWTNVDSIRAQMETEGIEVNPDEIWRDARDRSPGREIVL